MTNQLPQNNNDFSFGDLDYAIDVNPIVMSRAPDPMEDYDNAMLADQDAFVKKEEEKHKRKMQEISRIAGVDPSRQQKKWMIEKLKPISAKSPFFQAMIRGQNMQQALAKANEHSIRKREQQRIELQKQKQLDVEQQISGIDGNDKIQALDTQVDDAVNESIKSGQINHANIVGVKEATPVQKVSQTVNSEKVTDNSVDEGVEKQVVGQDDNSLSVGSQLAIDEQQNDPSDLLNDIQMNFEVVSAEQTVTNEDNQNKPMINLNLKLGSIPNKLKDRNGFVVSLSKKDIAKIKTELEKRLPHQMTYPVPIKTFNKLLAGNRQSTYSVSELSTAILSGSQVNFSKSITESKPLKFSAPMQVLSVGKSKEKQYAVQPDWDKLTTPVDELAQKQKQESIAKANRSFLKDYIQQLKQNHVNNQKKDLKLEKTTKQSKETVKRVIKKSQPEAGPEL